jgi:hypothetical protein
MAPDPQAGPPGPPQAPGGPPRWHDPAAFAATAPPDQDPRRAAAAPPPAYPGGDASSGNYRSPEGSSPHYRAPQGGGSAQYRAPEGSSGNYRAPEGSSAQYGAPAEPSQPPPQAVQLAPSRTQAQRDAAATDPEQVAPNSPVALAGFLVSFDERELGQFWPVHQGQTVVGRKGAADGLDIEFDHPTTSSRHAVLLASARPARIKLEDQGSTNGTFVNDHKLEAGKRHELRDGDLIRFGGFVAIVKIV